MDLYPDINDPDFQAKLAKKREFRSPLYSPDGLHEHQEFVRRFLSPYTPYKCLLLFHALGSGKSFACIAVAVDYYIHSGYKCIVVTKGESGRNNFLRQVKLFHNMSQQRDMWDPSIFLMRRYIALSNYISKKSDDELFTQFSNMTIVFDEIHNVNNTNLINILCESSSLSPSVNDEISANVLKQLNRLLLCAKHIIVLMCTATPMTDTPDQIRSILALCNTVCSRNYLRCATGIVSYNDNIKDKPNAIFEGDDYRGIKLLMSEMISHQRDTYINEKQKGTPNDIYRSLTHISLFCTPDYHGRHFTESEMYTPKITITYHTQRGEQRNIKYVKYCPKQSLINYLRRPQLAECSAKYNKLLNFLEYGEKTFVFIEEVQGSGLLLLAAILEVNGYQMYAGEPLHTLKPNIKRFTICVGRLDICPNIEDRLEGFNCFANNTGDYIQVLLGSKVISESISLLNVTQFHSITPHWNHSTIDQAIGRVIRSGSHFNLIDKTVKVYRHVAFVQDRNTKYGIDLDKINKSIDKQAQINDIISELRDNAVEKECFNPRFLPPDDFRTFAAVYAKYYIYDFINHISKFLSIPSSNRINSCTLSELSNLTKHHELVCKEVVAYIITRNIPVFKSNTHNLYLRIYSDNLFAVSDPSLPFVTLLPMQPFEVIESHYKQYTPLEPEVPPTQDPFPPSYLDPEIFSQLTSPELFDVFRYLPVIQKTSFVEFCILKEKTYILDNILFDYLYDNDTNIYYHFIMYKNLTTSYTSSTPIPKHSQGKTRYFDGNTWSYLQDDKEILQCYRTLINNKIEDLYAQFGYVGIISSIDGKMRLRLRQHENLEKSETDLRYIMRGRSLHSISKNTLQEIYASLMQNSSRDITSFYNLSIAQLASLIDAKLVSMSRYIII
jgi:hypothetical protein